MDKSDSLEIKNEYTKNISDSLPAGETTTPQTSGAAMEQKMEVKFFFGEVIETYADFLPLLEKRDGVPLLIKKLSET